MPYKHYGELLYSKVCYTVIDTQKNIYKLGKYSTAK